MNTSTWTRQNLKDHCEITSSKRIFANEYLTLGVPFYRGKEISEKQRSSSEVSDLIYISRDKFEEIKSKYGVPQKGDLLLTSVGTIGNPYLVKENEEFYFKDGNLTWFKNFKDLNSKWLYYWLLSSEGKSELNKSTIGSSQKAYTIQLLSKMQFTLPDLEMQNKVANALSSYDELIENNEKRIRILEEMAQRLYIEWFVSFKFPGYEKVKMVDSGTEYGLTPEGWQVKPLSQVVFVNPITKMHNSDNVLHIPMECLSNALSVIDLNKTFRNTKVSGPKFINGDTLFARITPCLQNGKTGYVNNLSEGEVACGSTEFVVLRPKMLTSIYTYLLSRTNNFRETAILTMVGASGRQRVRSEFFENYRVLVPNENLLSDFENRVSGNFLEIKNLYKANVNLSKIRDLLIPQLVTGKRKMKVL